MDLTDHEVAILKRVFGDELEGDLSLNKHQQIALKRLVEIEYSAARMMRKISENHPRTEDLKKRLAQYQESIPLCESTLKTGRQILLKGKPTEKGVVVSVPAGAIDAAGGGVTVEGSTDDS